MSEHKDGEWFVGAGGGLFLDYNGFRYCIQSLRRTPRASPTSNYVIARNGVEIAVAPSVADAKLYVKREG